MQPRIMICQKVRFLLLLEVILCFPQAIPADSSEKLSPSESYSLDVLTVDSLPGHFRHHGRNAHHHIYRSHRRLNTTVQSQLKADDFLNQSDEITNKNQVKSNTKYRHRLHDFRRSSQPTKKETTKSLEDSDLDIWRCSDQCKTPSWRRSRKTRRHDRMPAFHSHHRHYKQELELKKLPSFDLTTPSVVTAQVMGNAFLPCRTHNIGDKSVSWIRNRDSHILTLDRYTFISDARFVSLFEAESESWTLQVKFIEESDAGRYECQVTTEPKMSRFVDVYVVVPMVVIPGGTELHVRSGSDVHLKCVISKALYTPPHVFWYHEERQVTEGHRGGIVRQAPLETLSKDSSVASLSIKNAKRKHAGNYTCAPAGLATAASVVLHVLNGEHPAAMQHGISLAPSQSTQFATPFFLCLCHLSNKIFFCFL